MDKIQRPTSQIAEPAAETETPLVPSHDALTELEIERLRIENTALQNALRTRIAREELTGSLALAGARSPELLFAAASANLQFSDNGDLQNAAALVADLKRRFPEQFGGHRPGGSIDAGAGTLAETQTLSAESLARMTPAQVQKLNWDDVRRVISER